MAVRILLSAYGKNRINYEKAFLSAGCETAFDVPCADLSSFDALVLCGGGDLDPKYYGEEKNGVDLSSVDPDRDEREKELFDCFFSAGKPVLGICRGHQLIHVFLGGKLIRDLPNAAFHRAHQGRDSFHETTAEKNSFLYNLYGASFVTNSSHHQAVKGSADGLIPVQRSNEDGVIEAQQHRSKPVFSVQWHPERLTGTFAKENACDGGKLISWFVALCEKEKLKKVSNLT